MLDVLPSIQSDPNVCLSSSKTTGSTIFSFYFCKAKLQNSKKADNQTNKLQASDQHFLL